MRKKISKLSEFLSMDLFIRSLQSLEKTAGVMIIVSWSAAVLMTGIALYTISVANHYRQKAETALAVEPMLPTIKRAPLARLELERIAERLRVRYRNLTFNVMPDGALEVTALDANNFTDWLGALSYLDTVAPQIRWAARDLCVGSECSGAALLRAAITAERVTFRAPVAPDLDAEPTDKGGKS